MAKKKNQDEAPKGSPAWMATFSDLMNLLLCFFVLLFAMSNVDEAKYTAVAESLALSFSIFNGGAKAYGDGVLVSNGATQLNQLDEYYESMGETNDKKENDEVYEDNQHGDKDDDQGQKTDDTTNMTGTAVGGDTPKDNQNNDSLEEMLHQANYEQTSNLYSEVSDLVEKYQLSDYLAVNVDAENYQFVSLEIKGAVLFSSGSAKLKSTAIPIISRIGDILNIYSDFNVEVIRHTDSVPTTSKSQYESNNYLSCARAISVAEYLIENKDIDRDRIAFTGRGDYEPIASNATAEGRAMNRRVEFRLFNSISSNR